MEFEKLLQLLDLDKCEFVFPVMVFGVEKLEFECSFIFANVFGVNNDSDSNNFLRALDCAFQVEGLWIGEGWELCVFFVFFFGVEFFLCGFWICEIVFVGGVNVLKCWCECVCVCISTQFQHTHFNTVS